MLGYCRPDLVTGDRLRDLLGGEQIPKQPLSDVSHGRTRADGDRIVWSPAMAPSLEVIGVATVNERDPHTISFLD